MKNARMNAQVFAAFLAMVSLSACGGDGESSASTDDASTSQPGTAIDRPTIRANAEFDAECVDRQLARNKSDVAELDAPLIIQDSKTEHDDLRQASIDVVVDVALSVSDTCVVRENR